MSSSLQLNTSLVFEDVSLHHRSPKMLVLCQSMCKNALFITFPLPLIIYGYFTKVWKIRCLKNIIDCPSSMICIDNLYRAKMSNYAALFVLLQDNDNNTVSNEMQSTKVGLLVIYSSSR